jgi:hypothetical protein
MFRADDFEKKGAISRIGKLSIIYCIKYNPNTYCICDISLSVFFVNILNNWVDESNRGLHHNNPKTFYFCVVLSSMKWGELTCCNEDVHV